MAEYSGFFDAEEVTQPDGSKVFDREYFANHFAEYFKLFIGNGVFVSPTNQLKIVAGTGMNVKLLPGWAFINGYWYHNDAEKTITIPSNVSPSDVNYSIHLTLSETADRKITQMQGVSTTLASGQIRLASIKIKPGVSTIYDADITDTRPDENQCGFVKGLVDVVDTNDLFLQFTNMFNTWFNAMKGQLTTDAAGNLQTQVNTLNERASLIGSDYVLSHVTNPLVSGYSITLYSGMKYVIADGKGTDGNAKRTLVTLGANITRTFTTGYDIETYDLFLDSTGALIDARANNCGVVPTVSLLPTTLPGWNKTEKFIYYVRGEHKYYMTSGSTTPNWQAKTYCKVGSIAVGPTAISWYLFKTTPNIMSNLGERADWVIETGITRMTGNIWNWTKYNSGKVDINGFTASPEGWSVGTAYMGGYFHKAISTFVLPFDVYEFKCYGVPKAAVLGVWGGCDYSGNPVNQFFPYIINGLAGALSSTQVAEWAIFVTGRWKA